jgi:hypothetical protein
MNQQGEACEGLVRFGKTGAIMAFHAVLEPYAGKARMYGSSGALRPGGRGATHYNYSVLRPQHGHRSRRASNAAASSNRSVAIESGTWRCLRMGAPGPEAFG